MTRPRTAFVLVELAAILAFAAVVGALLLVLGKGSRHNVWQAGSIANLHEFAAVTSSYQADNTDQFWSYSWRSNTATPSQYADLRGPFDPIGTAAAQATDIMRRRGRADIPLTFAFIPTVQFHHLPLADYLDGGIFLRFAVSPGDRNRRLWSNDPDGYWRGDYQPSPGSVTAPYSSSYFVPQAFFCPDAVNSSHGTVTQAGDLHYYQASGPSFDFGGRRLGEVAFASRKVHVFDSVQWQGVRTPVVSLYSFARVPVLMVDGSTRVRVTAGANSGFQPGTPRSSFPTLMTYTPNAWEPPVQPGVQTYLQGMYYWTRAGLRGRDFDGDETPTDTW